MERIRGEVRQELARFGPVHTTGRIVEAWAEWDNLTGLAQLGHYEPPA